MWVKILTIYFWICSLNTWCRSANVSYIELKTFSDCSKQCGKGVKKAELMCVENYDFFSIPVPSKHCNHLQKPIVKEKTCNNGECNSEYLWKTTHWSRCSQSCGAAGIKTRDVECLYKDYVTKKYVTTNANNCDLKKRPRVKEVCHQINCPPMFLPGKWSKCRKGFGCQPGTQRRKLKCIGLLSDGKAHYHSMSVCYSNIKYSKSYRTWQKCFDFVNTAHCLQLSKRKPVFQTDASTVKQMRKTKRMNLSIGQVAYILIHTKILITCPINYFVQSDIAWKHNDKTYRYIGKSRSRIRVDKQGRLRIRKFLYEDRGKWFCVAGDSHKKSIIIKVRTRSAGYYDWAERGDLWNSRMLNEDPQTAIARQDVVQWTPKPWGACSVSCGSEGVQYREVSCEKVETRLYIVLEDKVCNERGLSKPSTKRVCNTASKCPEWKIFDLDKNRCTGACTDVNTGSFFGNVTCQHQNRLVEDRLCNIATKPNIDCLNTDCQVEWFVSDWSKCSVSCGGSGLEARYILCVWKTSGKPAGDHCYKQNLSIPKLTRSCQAPSCHLACVNFSSSCGKHPSLCRYAIYRYQCCAACRRHFYNKKRAKWN